MDKKVGQTGGIWPNVALHNDNGTWSRQSVLSRNRARKMAARKPPYGGLKLVLASDDWSRPKNVRFR